MKTVKLYTTPACPFCVRAKQALAEERIPFQEIDLSNDQELRIRLSTQTGWKTVPMIFIGEDFVGGYQELIQMKQSGHLMHMVQGDYPK